MNTMLAFIGSLVIASLGFLFGKFFSESEKILAEKRKIYSEFLELLPPLQNTYSDTDDAEFQSTLQPAMALLPKLLFYADKTVSLAWDELHKKYWESHRAHSSSSPALTTEFKALAKAQNDLVLEMRRDAFRWSMFNYSGKSRIRPKK